MVHFFHPERRCAGLKAASIAKYFVWADIASFLVQAAGGMMLNPGSGADVQRIGLKVYMAGVGVQEGFIVSDKLQFWLCVTDIVEGRIHHSWCHIRTRHVPNRTGGSNPRKSDRLALANVDYFLGSCPHYSVYLPTSFCSRA